jgi:hypothetical protein
VTRFACVQPPCMQSKPQRLSAESRERNAESFMLLCVGTLDAVLLAACSSRPSSAAQKLERRNHW